MEHFIRDPYGELRVQKDGATLRIRARSWWGPTRTLSWPLAQGRLHLELDRPRQWERALFTVPGMLLVGALGLVAPSLLKYWPPGLWIIAALAIMVLVAGATLSDLVVRGRITSPDHAVLLRRLGLRTHLVALSRFLNGVEAPPEREEAFSAELLHFEFPSAESEAPDHWCLRYRHHPQDIVNMTPIVHSKRGTSGGGTGTALAFFLPVIVVGVAAVVIRWTWWHQGLEKYTLMTALSAFLAGVMGGQIHHQRQHEKQVAAMQGSPDATQLHPIEVCLNRKVLAVRSPQTMVVHHLDGAKWKHWDDKGVVVAFESAFIIVPQRAFKDRAHMGRFVDALTSFQPLLHDGSIQAERA